MAKIDIEFSDEDYAHLEKICKLSKRSMNTVVNVLLASYIVNYATDCPTECRDTKGLTTNEQCDTIE